MFQVYVTAREQEDWQPVAVGPFATGAEAAALVARLKEQHSATHRYKIRPVEDASEVTDDAWKERERANVNAERYALVPWYWAEFNHDLREEHFPHLSLTQPGKIAFTPDATKGRADRQTIMAPGRYLKRYFGEVLSACEIERWAAKVDIEGGLCELHFTQDPDEIEDAYVNGPGSCMSHNADNYQSDVHPVRAYGGSPDLALAYIGTLSEVSGRAIVWPERMIYSSQYGDCSRMQLLLKNAGYRSGRLEGARLRRLPQGRGFVVPYVDGCSNARDDGDWLVLDDEDGSISVCSTEGLSVETYNCEHCGDRTQEDLNEVNVRWGDTEEWCGYCARNDSFTCSHDGERYSTRYHTAVEVHQLRTTMAAYWERHTFTVEVQEDNLEGYGAVYHEETETWAMPEVLELARVLQELAQAMDLEREQTSLDLSETPQTEALAA